jgi:HlyD family secretion protein
MNLKEKVKSFPAWFKTTSKKNKLGVIVGALVVIFILSKVLGGDKEKIEYEYYRVKKGKVDSIYSETGEIQSSNVTMVASTIEGVVGEVYVDNGAVVYRGQNLFYVTSTATEQERALAYSNYLTAVNALETAKYTQLILESDMWVAHEDFEEQSLDTELSVDDPIYIETDRDWQASEDKYLNQQQVIKQTQAAVSNAWLKYQAMIDGVVKSTANGTIQNLAVASGQQVGIVGPVLLIEQQADVWVKILVNEVNIDKIELEQTAEIILDAWPDKTYQGEVKRADQVGVLDQGVVVYSVYLVISDADEKILPAMTVSVDVELEKKENVLMVPNKAVKVYQGDKAVQVMDKKTDQVIYLPVQIGPKGLMNTEIVLGLEEGQEIIVGEESNNDSSSQPRGMFGPR